MLNPAHEPTTASGGIDRADDIETAADEQTRRTLLRYSGVAGLGGLGALAASGCASTPETAPAAAPATAQEGEAAALISDFLAAWPSRDAAQITSFVADDVVFKATPNDPEVKGKAAFLEATARFLALPFVKKQLDFAQRPQKVHAVGGPLGTAVMALRVDYFNGKKGKIDVPLVGAFWVVGGKIKNWYDLPLVNNLGPGEGQSW